MTTSLRGLLGMLAAAPAAVAAALAAPQGQAGGGRLTEGDVRQLVLSALAANNAERDRTAHARAEADRRRFS